MKRMIGLALGSALLLLTGGVVAQQSATPMPVFEPDPSWPQLPGNQTLVGVTKVSVDRNDNVYILHRPRQAWQGRTPVPGSVVVIDANGKFVRSWGGPGAGYDWPDVEHNIFVDHNDNVFISGSSPGGASTTRNSDDMILKFTADGKFLRQFGGRSRATGSKDLTAVNKPGDFSVWPKTNELFVADGYGNRRVLVLDADTFAFKRMWAAFGRVPTDDPGSGGRSSTGAALPGQAQTSTPDVSTIAVETREGSGAERFVGAVHGVLVSNDGIVYVVDRNGKRVQLFTPQGKYIDQFFVNRSENQPGSASGLAFSADREQRYLYVSDFFSSRIVVVERKSRRILYQFGQRGGLAGHFQGLHHIATDSKGNLFTTEAAGSRAQKFVFKGTGNTPPANAFPASSGLPPRLTPAGWAWGNP